MEREDIYKHQKKVLEIEEIAKKKSQNKVKKRERSGCLESAILIRSVDTILYFFM